MSGPGYCVNTYRATKGAMNGYQKIGGASYGWYVAETRDWYQLAVSNGFTYADLDAANRMTLPRIIGPPSHPIIYNKWYMQRCRRSENAMDDIDADARTWHRKCPTCDGYGSVQVAPATRIDPPDYDDCPTCEGVRRVNQERWEQGMERIRDEAAYWDNLAEQARVDKAMYYDLDIRADHPEDML